MESVFKRLVDPELVKSFQRFCGVDSYVWRKKSRGHGTGRGNNMADGNIKHAKSGCENGIDAKNGVQFPYGVSEGDSELRERLGHKNGVDRQAVNGYNGVVQNGHCHEHDETQVNNGKKTEDELKGNEGVANPKVAMVAEFLNDTLGEELKTDSEVDFKIRNTFLYYLFNVGANLGNEAFYILFFPTLIWNVDSWVARRMIIFWCLYMYIGQATKDVLKIPRPPSPPVIRIERRYALEYGMPSTHAMTGLGMPFTILYLVYGRYDFPFVIGFALAAVWCVTVSLSRLYLGMHTILDILAGLLYTLAMMPIYYFWMMEAIDSLTLNNTYAPIFLVGVPLFWCLTYPKLDTWSTARGDTTLVLGTGVGQALGHWWSKWQGIMHPGPPASAMPMQISMPTLSSFTQATMRLLVGTLLLVITRLVVKTIVFEVSCLLSGVNRKDPKAKEQLAVELPCKYITYIAIALCCTVVCPMVFVHLGIQREAFYHEL